MAKDELNYKVIFSKICGVLKGKDWFEETSRTLLTPSSPREAMGNDLYGLCHWPANRLALYNSAYHGWTFLKDVYIYSFEFYCCWTYSSSFLLAYGSLLWTTPSYQQWPRSKIYQRVLESIDERDEDRTTLQHCFPSIVRWISRSQQLHVRALALTTFK